MAKGFKQISVPDETVAILERISLEKVGGSETLAPSPAKVIEYLAKKEVGLEAKL